MTVSSTDRIEKEVQLKASQSRVWRAITTPAEFGAWFKVDLENETFVPGEEFQGQITYEGCEQLRLQAWVEKLEPEHYFSFRWHAHAWDPAKDYSADPTTLIEFVLTERDGGTHLKISESGFDQLPEEVRQESFMRNEGGWEIQTENIRAHVDG